MGIDGNLLKWLSSFVSDRLQIVKYKNSFSREIAVSSGVLQSFYLGPLLFNMFTNNVRHVLKYSNLLLFVDDLKIFCRISGLVDALKL